MNNLTILMASSVICFLSSPAFAHRIAPAIDGNGSDREPKAALPSEPTPAEPTRIG